MLNVRVTAGHRPAETQEEPAGWVRFAIFCLRSQKFLAKLSQKIEFLVACWWFCDGMCETVLVLSIYKKVKEKSAV